MKRQKAWSVVFVVLLIALALTACATPTPEVEEEAPTAVPEDEFSWRKYEGTTIRVLGPTHDFLITTVTDLLPSFEEDTGIEVQLEHYPEDQSRDKQQIELTAGNPNLDVIYYQPKRSGTQFYEAGALEVLDPYLNDPTMTPPDYGFPEDFFEGSVNQGTIDEEVVAVMTDRGQAPVLFYNRELLEEYGVDVPATFEELETAAKEIYEKSDGEIYGIVNRGDGASTTSQFSYTMHEFGARWEDEDGNPTINTPEWIDAAEWWGRTLRESGPDGATAYSWAECVNDMQQEKAAFTLELAITPARINDPDSSRVTGKMGAVIIPHGPAYEDGDESYRHVTPCEMGSRFGLSINAASENRGAAWLFITYMTSRQAQLNYLLLGRPAARTSVWTDPTFKTAVRDNAWYWDARIEASDICYATPGYAPPSIQNQPQARDIIGNVLQGSILGEDVAALAAEAQTELEELLASEQAAEE